MQRDSLSWGFVIMTVAVVAVGCGSQVQEGAPSRASQTPAMPAAKGTATDSATPGAGPEGAAVSLETLLTQSMRVPEDPQQRAQAQAELTARWREAAKEVKENGGFEECMLIAVNLRNFGPEALLPLVDVLADPDTPPYTKVVAVNCLTGMEHPVMIKVLEPLLDATHDGTTRACAAHVLGAIATPEVKPIIENLLNDPEPRVRFAALRGMAMCGDPDARQNFANLWDSPDTTSREREEIARMFVNDVKNDKENVAIVSKVLQDTELDVSLRQLAVAALGRASDPAALPALKAAAEKDPDQYVRDISASAASMIEAKEAASPAPGQEERQGT